MKSKEKKKTEAKRPIVLIGTQNKKNTNLVLSLIIKLLLTYVLCAGTLMCFADFYNIPYELSSAISHVLLFVTPLFPVFLVARKRYTVPVIVVICIIFYSFLHETINNAMLLLWEHLLLTLDSRLLQTAQFVPHNSIAFLTKTKEYLSLMGTATFIVAGIVCLTTVFFTHKKFSAIGTIITWAILYIPAFIAERADYNPYVLIMVPAFFALHSISSNLFEEERLLAKRTKKDKKKSKPQNGASYVEAAIAELSKHSRNCICGILAGAIAFTTFFSVQSFFPGYSTLDVKEIVNTVTDFFSDAGDYIGSIFSGEGGAPFNGYFSSDNFFTKNDIGINAPPFSSEKPVLKIRADKPDSFYLVGDVGVDFTGSTWTSVIQKDKNGSLSYDGYNIDKNFKPDLLYQIYISDLIFSSNNYTSNEFNQLNVYFSSIDDAFATLHLDKYYTESQNTNIYSILRSIASYSHISIDYLQNTDIVFKPYVPANTSYAYNEQFSVYADSAIRISDKKNWMKNFETDVISPVYSLWFASTTSDTLSANTSYEALQSIGFTDKEAAEYHQNKLEYDRYIKDNYSHVPDSEKENMQKLLSEFEASYDISPSALNSDYMYAFALCEYLKHKYTYSLTANNSSDSENTILGKFLFKTKEGHCALYASSMVLALREHGLPARYVSGFSTGELTLNEDTGYYEKTLVEQDLHAWVEVYFPNLGWMAFDPTGWSDDTTPSTGDPDGTTPQATTPPTNTTTSNKQTTPPVSSSSPDSSEVTTPPQTSQTTGNSNAGLHGEKGNNNPLLIILLILAVIIIIIAIIYLTAISVGNKIRNRWKRFATGDCTTSVKEMHLFIMKLFAVTDITPEISELPTEFAVRVDALMNISDKRNNLQDIMRVIEKAEFSANGVSQEERKQVYIYTRMLYDLVMKSAGRLKQIYLKFYL